MKVSDILLSQDKIIEDLRYNIFIIELSENLYEQIYCVVDIELENSGKGIFAKILKTVLQEIRIQKNTIQRKRAIEVYPNKAVSWKPNKQVPEKLSNIYQRANASNNI